MKLLWREWKWVVKELRQIAVRCHYCRPVTSSLLTVSLSLKPPLNRGDMNINRSLHWTLTYYCLVKLMYVTVILSAGSSRALRQVLESWNLCTLILIKTPMLCKSFAGLLLLASLLENDQLRVNLVLSPYFTKIYTLIIVLNFFHLLSLIVCSFTTPLLLVEQQKGCLASWETPFERRFGTRITLEQ